MNFPLASGQISTQMLMLCYAWSALASLKAVMIEAHGSDGMLVTRLRTSRGVRPCGVSGSAARPVRARHTASSKGITGNFLPTDGFDQRSIYQALSEVGEDWHRVGFLEHKDAIF